MILIAGPVRSGTEGNQSRIANLQKRDRVALQFCQKGHTPGIAVYGSPAELLILNKIKLFAASAE